MYRQALRIKAVGICIDDCLTENDANIRGVKLLMRIEPVTCNSKGLGGPGIDNSQSGYFKWACISRCDREMVFCSRSSNVSIGLPDRLSGCSGAGHQVRV